MYMYIATVVVCINIIFTVTIFTIIFIVYIYRYVLQEGHSVGCDRTNSLCLSVSLSLSLSLSLFLLSLSLSLSHTHTHAHTQSGKTALHIAASNGHGGVAEALLKAGCNPDLQDTV
jgi:ankyrin repeat protein